LPAAKVAKGNNLIDIFATTAYQAGNGGLDEP
jgi:hypothetical protein